MEYTNRKADLNSVALVDRGGLGLDQVSHVGGLQVVDAQLNSRHPLEAGSEVRPNARQRLRYQRRHPPVHHLERLLSGSSKWAHNINSHRKEEKNSWREKEG